MDKTIVVLSDGSTYDVDAEVLLLNEDGCDELDDSNDAKTLSATDVIASVTLGELLELWNATHGTEF